MLPRESVRGCHVRNFPGEVRGVARSARLGGLKSESEVVYGSQSEGLFQAAALADSALAYATELTINLTVSCLNAKQEEEANFSTDFSLCTVHGVHPTDSQITDSALYRRWWARVLDMSVEL